MIQTYENYNYVSNTEETVLKDLTEFLENLKEMYPIGSFDMSYTNNSMIVRQ